MTQATQPAPPVPTYAAYPDAYPPKFVRYHDKYPQVYESIVRILRQLKARGFRDLPIRYCIEHTRLSEEAPRPSRETAFLYAIDNNFAPWYGRLISAQEPDLRGCIRMRRTSYEIATAEEEPSQLGMEFE